MKKYLAVLLTVSMLFALTSLLVQAGNSEKPVGQFVFDKNMNVSWWDHHAACRTTYDAAEDAFKITPAGGSAVMCDGHNAGTIDYFEDMGYSSFPVGGEGGYNYVKIKIKLPKGFDISGSAYKAARLTLGDKTKGLAQWNKVDNPTFDFDGVVSDGEWHEYIANITVQNGKGASFEGQPSFYAENTVEVSKLMFALGTNVEGPVYLKYIAFFKTEAEARAYTGAAVTEPEESKTEETKAEGETPAETEPEETKKEDAPKTGDMTSALLVLALAAGACTVAFRRKNH